MVEGSVPFPILPRTVGAGAVPIGSSRIRPQRGHILTLVFDPPCAWKGDSGWREGGYIRGAAALDAGG